MVRLCGQVSLRFRATLPESVAAVALVWFTISCGGGTGISSSSSTTSSVTIQISPSEAIVLAGGNQTFSAAISGTQNQKVIWMVAGIPGGNTSVGRISSDGFYSAPSTVPLGGGVIVSAKSVADQSQLSSAQVQIVSAPPAVVISISPTQASIHAGASQLFTASVTGTSNTQVTWAINGILGGDETLGTISSAGLYTAPTNLPGTISVTVTAQSSYDPQESANAIALITGGSGEPPACGPPSYNCARTDLAASPIGQTLPNWGGAVGANTIFFDNSFNLASPVHYVRVTDVNSIAAHPHTQFTADIGGSGDENHFNADDTLFTIGDIGGNTYFFGLDPQTMSTGLVWDNVDDLAAVGAFSQSDRNIYYSFQADGKIKKFDLTNCVVGSCTPPPASTLYDFAANCGVAGALQWHAIGGIGGGDAIFAGAYSTGIQNSGHSVVVWNQTTSKCYLYDTSAGTVTQYPGAIQLGTISVPDRYTVHNVKLDPSGTWLVVIAGSCLGGTCNAHAWQIGTTTVKTCVRACGGHFTETAAGWLNNDNRPGDVYLQTQMLFRQWEKFDTTSNDDLTPLTAARPDIGLTWSTHPGAKNDPFGTHDYPAFNCMYSPATEITEPWASEIVAYSQATGALYRFGHSFNSNYESFFQAEYCIGAASSTGNFYEFTTDGEGSFGSTADGGSNCLLGGPPPLPQHSYALGDLTTVTTGAEPVFKVTVAGTTDSSIPVWPTTIGASLKWGTATLTNQGASTCRSDVMIVRAQ